jgi:1-phosphofructokinase family hexose kinase
MIVCVAGNPAIDKLFQVEAIVPGEIHRPREFVPLPGGKGIHVAQVATALGAEAIATGILGGHHGRWLAETLAGEGVPGVFAWTEGETRSCLTVADQVTGSLTEFYEDGILATLENWAALAGIVDELLRHNPTWLAMAGSVPTAEPDLPGYPSLVRAARAAGVRSAVDSRGSDLAQAIESGPDLVKINALEAGELLETAAIDDVARARAAAEEIRDRAGGDGHGAVITLGEQGVVLVEPGGAAWHGTVAARGDYPVGSGDAFLAGLLTALTRSDADAAGAWPQATAVALGAAAANAEIPGAARVNPARARELAAKAELHRL